MDALFNAGTVFGLLGMLIHYKSGTEWTDLVADAEKRKCIFSATNDATICKLVLQVKQELDELDDLLNADSAVFSNTRWKVSIMVLASLTLNIVSCFLCRCT